MKLDFAFEHGDVLRRLRCAIDEAGSARAWAREHGFSSTYLSEVVNGTRSVSDRMAQALGFRRVVAFVATEDFVEG
jgi:hypothetical protein